MNTLPREFLVYMSQSNPAPMHEAPNSFPAPVTPFLAVAVAATTAPAAPPALESSWSLGIGDSSLAGYTRLLLIASARNVLTLSSYLRSRRGIIIFLYHDFSKSE